MLFLLHLCISASWSNFSFPWELRVIWNNFWFELQKTERQYFLDFSWNILICLKNNNLEKLFYTWEKISLLVGQRYKKEIGTSVFGSKYAYSWFVSELLKEVLVVQYLLFFISYFLNMNTKFNIKQTLFWFEESLNLKLFWWLLFKTDIPDL